MSHEQCKHGWWDSGAPGDNYCTECDADCTECDAEEREERGLAERDAEVARLRAEIIGLLNHHDACCSAIGPCDFDRARALAAARKETP